MNPQYAGVKNILVKNIKNPIIIQTGSKTSSLVKWVMGRREKKRDKIG